LDWMQVMVWNRSDLVRFKYWFRCDGFNK
jgi:hypothetical protein